MPLAMYRVETLRLAPGIAPGRDVLIDRPIGPTPGPIGALHASSGFQVATSVYRRLPAYFSTRGFGTDRKISRSCVDSALRDARNDSPLGCGNSDSCRRT